MSIYDNEGIVLDSITGAGLSELSVEVWDVGGVATSAIATAITRADGSFIFSLNSADLIATLEELPGSLFFRVYEGAILLVDTEGKQEWRLDNPIYNSRIIISQDVSALVDGTVSDAAGGPLAGAEVKAFSRRLGATAQEEILLGEAPTNSEGRYRVRYTIADGRPVNLVVRAFDAGANLLAESAEISRAPARAAVDLTVGGELWQPSEVERMDEELTRELAVHNTELHSLPEDAVRSLARSTKQSGDAVVQLANAAALAQSTGLSREVFYGLARQGVPADLHVLLAANATTRAAAFQRAIDARIVPAPSGQTVTDVLNSLSAALVTFAMQQQSAPGRPAIKDVLASSLVDPNLHAAFLAHYVARSDDDAAFWQAVEEDSALSADVAELKIAFQVANVLQGFVEVMFELRELRDVGTYLTLREIAAIDRADWVQMVEQTGSPIPFPPHIPGDTEQERLDHYVDAVVDVFESLFPSDATRNALLAGTALTQHSSTFLTNNTNLDLLVDNIDAYVAAQGASVFDGIVSSEDQQAALADVKAVQRVMRVVTKGRKAKALFEAGFRSASQIASAPHQHMMDRLGGQFSEKEIVQMRQYASSQSAAVQAVSLAAQQLNAWLPAVMKPASAPSAASASWASLFGGQSFCRCEHCRSVYSPAAYLVDLLAMLDQGAVDSPTNPVEILFERRPDLQNLQLSCANTNTSLPYIDVVNEVLESYIKGQYVDDPTSPVSTGDNGDVSAEVLRAAPQRTLHEAYGQLAAEVFPVSMPYVRSLDVARSYLAQMGVSRLAVMRGLRGDSAPSADEFAAEQLNLSQQQADVITGASSAADYSYYGFDVANENDWHAVLSASIPEIMARAAVSFDELTELVQLRFVRAGAVVAIQPASSACDINEMTIVNADQDVYLRMNRLIRLQRALGWSFIDLDRAIRAIAAGALDAAALRSLACIERYRVTLKMSVAEVCALWSNLDTWGDDSLYQQVFLPKTVLSTTLASRFALLEDGSELADTTPALSAELPAIAAALGLDDAALDELIVALGSQLKDINGANMLSANLSLSNLSLLYRHARLAQALAISVEPLMALLAMAGPSVSPFSVGDAVAAESFLELVLEVRAGALSIDMLSYICAHTTSAAQQPAPTDARIDRVFSLLQQELVAIATQNAAPAIYDRNAAEVALAQVVAAGAPLVNLVSALDPDTIMSQSEREALYEAHVTFDDSGIVTGIFFDDYNDMFGAVSAPETHAARRDFNLQKVVETIRPMLVERQSNKAVTRLLAAEFKLDESVMANLLERHVTAVQSADRMLTELRGLHVEAPATPASFESLRPSYLRIFKAAMVVNATGIKAEWMGALLAMFDGSTAAPIDISALPVDDLGDPSVPFAAYRSLDGMMELARQLRTGSANIVDVVTANSVEDAVQAIVAGSGWRYADVRSLVEDRLNWTVAEVSAGQQLRRVIAAMDVVRRLGASTEQALSWTSSPSAAQADSIVQALRTHYSEQRWLEVARGVNDPLRNRQRQAMVAFLLPRLAAVGVSSERDLFAHFLIDVEMTSCMNTSRVKQAISSVQLFIQRVLLNLESEVPSTAIDSAQWRWRKSYRVWEANRKVFLYPENWIEPELRSDKSPFFAELESELRQGELDEQAIETALSNYLYKLDEVARLEVVAHYQPASYDGRTPWTIVARTPSKPHRYFSRKLDADGNWSAWVAMDIEIQADHHVLFEMHGRLYLGWPQFTEQQESEGEAKWSIQFFVSEYRVGHWSTPLASLAPLTSRVTAIYLPPSSAHSFSVSTDDGLHIHCHRYGLAPNTEYQTTVNELLGEFWLDQYQSYPNFKWIEAVLVAAGKKPNEFTHYEVDLLETIHVQLYASDPHYKRRIHAATPSAYIDDQVAALGTPQYVSVWQRVGTWSLDCGRLVVEDDPFDAVEEDWSGYGVPEGAFFSAQDGRLVDLSHGLAFGSNALMASVPAGALITRPSDASPWPRSYFPFFLRANNEQYMAVPTRSWLRPERTSAEKTILAASGKIIKKGYFDMGTVVDVAAPLQRAPGVSVRALVTADEGPSITAPGSYRMARVYHPFVCGFVEALQSGGIDGLMDLSVQQLSLDQGGSYFNASYGPTSSLVAPRPRHAVDFRANGSFQQYNWELFFHVPLLIATRLNQEQRHEQAQRWFHFIFDPTVNDAEPSAKRFWRCQPLRDTDVVASVNDMMVALADPDNNSELMDDVRGQIAAWMAHPFEPHRIAQVRRAAYMKTVVMKYIDNLIDWADRLFRQDTVESINEATQLYVLAANILGKRPIAVPPLSPASASTYADLRGALSGDEAMNNAMVAAENHDLPPFYSLPSRGSEVNATIGLLAFCVPHNEQLMGYWDRVDDRLFKIRHCLNIEGVERSLPLFQPPIDPALLVRAQAAGVDLSSVIDGLNAGGSPYRFAVLLSKAQQFAGETRAFGSAMLSAIEKQDAEALASLRSQHEVAVLDAMRDIKQSNIKEAQIAQESLRKAREHAESRLRFYRSRTEAGVTLIAEETASIEKLAKAQSHQVSARAVQGASSLAALLPNITFGLAPGSTFGGLSLSAMFSAVAEQLRSDANDATYQANRAGTSAGHRRRHDEWVLQAEQAEKEVERIDKDLLSAEIREAIARADLSVHERQRNNARDVSSFLRDKFNNTELYGWMVGKLREVYFAAYKLAYDMARRAEAAYRYERGLADSNFVRFGYWDSLKRGLLAGEQLSLDLQRLDVAHSMADKREYELSKAISLSRLDPAELFKLRQNGVAIVELPEALFDLDYPGHYLRRIKSVRLTLPAVAGPFTSVNCKLTLLSSSYRTSADASDNYASSGGNDTRFSHRAGLAEAICTSHGQSDGGVFELSFQDPRYLPFEGAGVISTWRIELDKQSNEFDLSTLSDVVMHLHYTARDGGAALAAKARPSPTFAHDATRMFSLRHEFPVEWNAFETALVENAPDVFDQVLEVSLAGKLPYLAGAGAIQASKARLALVWAEPADAALTVPMYLKPSDTSELATPLAAGADSLAEATLTTVAAEAAAWRLRIDSADLLDTSPLASVTEEYEGGRRILPGKLADVLLIVDLTRPVS